MGILEEIKELMVLQSAKIEALTREVAQLRENKTYPLEMSVQEAAGELNTSQSVVRRLFNDETIKGRQPVANGKIYLKTDSVLAYKKQTVKQ